jgi:hypothetical protein
MTIKIPKKTIGDRVLKALGKKRGVQIPAETHKQFGPYAYATAQKESFLKALLRPKDEPLPDGMVDIDLEEHR